MMKIGVTADTHSRTIPKKLLDAFKNVDLIVHAGDFCDMDIVRKFESIQELKAVYGNMDGPDIRKKFPRKQIFTAGPYTIGLFHGEGAPHQLLPLIESEFGGENPDVIIFGHSHEPFNEKRGEVLYFNPGSPNDIVFAPYCSYGIIELSDNAVKGKIVKI